MIITVAFAGPFDLPPCKYVCDRGAGGGGVGERKGNLLRPCVTCVRDIRWSGGWRGAVWRKRKIFFFLPEERHRRRPLVAITPERADGFAGGRRRGRRGSRRKSRTNQVSSYSPQRSEGSRKKFLFHVLASRALQEILISR